MVILGGGRGTRLASLTGERSKPAVPVAGKYRLVDIPISNALHSGMKKMLLLTQYLQHSLTRHIASTYRFDQFTSGYVNILAAEQTAKGERWFQGTADAVRATLDTIDNMGTDLVLILAGDHMYRMDYREMVDEHIRAEADVTVAVQPCSEAEIAGFGALRVDETGRITEFREKPKTETERNGMELDPAWLAARGIPKTTPYLGSMGIYLFNKQVLFQGLAGDALDFGGEVIPAAVNTRKVQSHFFTGYWRDIGTVSAFFEAHMDLLGPEPQFRVDDPDWPIFTHPRFLPCAKVDVSTFDQSMLAEGSSIAHSTIERSIIGVRSRIEGATIRESIVMGADSDPPSPREGEPPVGIGHGTVIQRAIIDKNARIGKNVRITNVANVMEADGENYAVRDGIVLIPKNGVIPDGTII